ncbi:hypothetical protein EON64_17370 [archaeon]|nr:MAG: hypothetical protein EON64_17370 [archaeon]
MKAADKINELFLLCGGPNGSVEMRSAVKLLWPTLSNAVSLVDLAGVFAVSIPSSLNSDVLNEELFSDFFRSFARLKFFSGSDFVEKLLEELGPVKRLLSDHAVLSGVAEKNAVRILLKFDLPLRRTFSLFCGKSLRGGRVTWEEVRQLSLGMEVYISFILYAFSLAAGFAVSTAMQIYMNIHAVYVQYVVVYVSMCFFMSFTSVLTMTLVFSP